MAGSSAPSTDTWQSVVARALAEVLDLLSPTTWLPALMLLANAYLLAHIPGEGTRGILYRLEGLDLQPPGFVGIVLLLLTALLIQSVQFPLLQMLQGYWGRSWIGGKVASLMIRRQQRRFQRYDRQRQKLARKSFSRGRARLKGTHVDSEVLAIMEAEMLGNAQPQATKEQVIAANAYGWRTLCEAPALRRIDELDRIASQRPLSHRMLPTRLGNTLRSAEDQTIFTVAPTTLLAAFDALPPSLVEQHDRFRRRMDMWCSLAALFALLAVVAGALLLVYRNEVALRLALVASYLIACLISHRASLYEAEGYGSVLIAIDQALALSRLESETALAATQHLSVMQRTVRWVTRRREPFVGA